MTKLRLPADRRTALEALRTAMVEKKLTQTELADAADCHEKTIQNLLHGRTVRNQTLFDVCMVLGLDFQSLREQWQGPESDPDQPMDLKGTGGHVSPVYMGAYTKAAVDHYIGTFLTLRPSFTNTENFVAYATNINWDPSWPSLLFEESGRPDTPFSHRGRLYIPASSMFIHLVSLTKGAMRMVMLSQLDQNGQMRGLITTINKKGAMLRPVSAPIIYVKVPELNECDLGEIRPDHDRYADYKALLQATIEDGYAHLCLMHPE